MNWLASFTPPLGLDRMCGHTNLIVFADSFLLLCCCKLHHFSRRLHLLKWSFASCQLLQTCWGGGGGEKLLGLLILRREMATCLQLFLTIPVSTFGTSLKGKQHAPNCVSPIVKPLQAIRFVLIIYCWFSLNKTVEICHFIV